MNPFEYVNSINQTKKNLIRESEDPVQTEKDYNPFLVNRSLSYFQDTIPHANEMNRYPNLDKLIQYEFFINSIRPRKRFSKWAKKIENADIAVIKEYYGYNDQLALWVLSVLTDEQFETIKTKLERGGVK